MQPNVYIAHVRTEYKGIITYDWHPCPDQGSARRWLAQHGTFAEKWIERKEG